MKNAKTQTVKFQMSSSMQVRIDNAQNDNMREFLTKQQTNFEKLSEAQIAALQALNIDFKTLSAQIALDKTNKEFLAQYALEKVIKACKALASGSSAMLDKYTFSIVKNLNTLQTLDNLNTQRAICSKIEIDLMQVEQFVKVYHNCSPSTASTQASSTRMMLQALNVCNVSKGSKADSISFTDSESALKMQALFA